MDTDLPAHWVIDLNMFGVVFKPANVDPEPEPEQPAYTAWLPSYEGEQPPF